jgi:DNA-binding response OmpR family regulator
MQKNILVIDDESALQKTLGEFLRTQNYNVISALDGELGIALAREKKPDLILLDLVMPKKNGFEVLKELKSDMATKIIPVIVLTNLSEMADIDKVLELGATTYLVKGDHALVDILQKVKFTLGEDDLG